MYQLLNIFNIWISIFPVVRITPLIRTTVVPISGVIGTTVVRIASVVNDMWVSFKSEVLEAIKRYIPTKMTKTKYSLPWVDSSIKRLIRKRDKLYFHARRSSSPDIKNHYKRFRAHVQKAIRDACWKHISNIFTLDTEIIDPDSPRKNEKAKKFW